MGRSDMLDREREDGFTLVELLIALALLALITAMLAGAIFAGGQGFRSLERMGSEASVDAIRKVIRELLVAAKPLREQGRREERFLFDGEASRVSFVTSYVPPGQYAGLYRISIWVQEGRSGPRTFDLALVQTLYRPAGGARAAAPRTPAESTTLMRGVRGVALRYYGARDDRVPAEWHTEWRHPDRLPLAVAVDVKLPSDDARTWPALVVHLPSGN